MPEVDKYSLWVKKKVDNGSFIAYTEWDMHGGFNKRSCALDVR